jgi:hypothetical protein
MDGELAGRDILRTATLVDEPLGQFGAFAGAMIQPTT